MSKSKKEKTEKRANKKKHPIRNRIILGLLAVCIIVAWAFLRFGALKPAECANVSEMKTYVCGIENIAFPKDTRIIALGEATHGNAEFQQLKLDVFKIAVEKFGVRAFAIEADYGCCEYVNRYIHGGDGTVQQAIAATGFTIYRTQQMADLLDYMRDYNQSAEEGEDLRFYGFDMQRYEYNYQYLVEACDKLAVDDAQLKKLVKDGVWNDEFDSEQRKKIINDVIEQLEIIDHEDTSQAVHFAQILLQNFRLGEVYNDSPLAGNGQAIGLRDKLMAENTLWISAQEKARGNDCIFITGHNGHVAQWGSYDKDNKIMGNLLADELGDGYYVIGTDFYKTKCNMPNQFTSKRSNQVFYSRDPLAKAAKKAGYDICWLDFSAVPKDSELYTSINDYTFLGSLGEGYTLLTRLLPYSYRPYQSPAATYDSMIFVASAHPIEIISEQ